MEETDGGLVITPAEDVVSNVSVQVNQDTNVTVKFYNGDLSTTVSAGLPQWFPRKRTQQTLRMAIRIPA